MIVPWTIGQEYVDENAVLTAVNSCGLVARLQYGVAKLIDTHYRFEQDKVPIVIDQIGDYISEMQRLNAATGLYWLVQTPEMERQRATEWAATVTAQAIETPSINRTNRGEYLTAMRACEMALAVLDAKTPDDGWAPLRVNRITRVQSDQMTCSHALVMQTRTILTVEAAPPSLLT
jgi:hypothetical protein